MRINIPALAIPAFISAFMAHTTTTDAANSRWCKPGRSSVCHHNKCVQRRSLLTHHLYQHSWFIFNTRTANVKLERITKKKTFQNTLASRGQFKCDGTCAETRFCLSAKRTSQFKSARGGHQFSGLLAAEVCASAVVMLDTPSSEVVWRVLATQSIRQYPLHFLSRVSSHFNWSLHV